jgi:hypothetical protein
MVIATSLRKTNVLLFFCCLTSAVAPRHWLLRPEIRREAEWCTLRKDNQVGPTDSSVISSVHTRNPSSVLGPNVVVIATSAASRPRAIKTLPMRGTLFRGSKVCQRPPTKASNQAAKSPGGYGGDVPTSPR